MPIFEDFGILEALGSLFAVVWAAIFAGKQTGRIRTPADPLIAEAVAALVETSRNVAATMLVISEAVKSNGQYLAKLDRQHGPEAKQGEYESWKFTPKHERDLAAAHRKAHAAGMMAVVALRMEIANDDEQRNKHFGEAEQAIAAWDRVKAEFT